MRGAGATPCPSGPQISRARTRTRTKGAASMAQRQEVAPWLVTLFDFSASTFLQDGRMTTGHAVIAPLAWQPSVSLQEV